MDTLDSGIDNARKRVAAFTEIARWIWCINALVMLIGAYYNRYELAALAGFTWILSLVAAAIGRRVVEYLSTVENSIRMT